MKRSCRTRIAGLFFRHQRSGASHENVLAGILGLSLVALGAGLSGNEKTVPNIEGTWVVTSRSYVRGGQIIKKEFGKPEVTYVFKDGNFKALLGDQDSYSGTYRIDATKSPPPST